MSIEPHHTLDVCGLFCPEPVMMLHNIFRDIDAGEVVEVWATDPATTRDIPKFCSFLGHELLVQDERNGKFFYLLKKRSGA
jgi:tRNA 2-thiouridine synthesizing protein A